MLRLSFKIMTYPIRLFGKMLETLEAFFWNGQSNHAKQVVIR
ncbi:Protein of unknown function [Pyronema omphalodes CBS 100304]|uniref:Uncharacterized protein n=1 Tax=Pyronema omphalodes (strain CBS 100304) TaxID=1076935 RepID=U4L6Y4_PYROM|nr:Protein of unknown function [Pyronema omphalodes CBS 100304]